MPSQKQKPFLKNTSKIKDIFIELFDYSFFHRPSSVDELDSRFIGREKIKEKLTTILKNSETYSGTYLITGFRGMGKTSLVNNVLNEVQGEQRSVRRTNSIFRIFLTVLFFSFLADKFTLAILSLMPSVFIFLHNTNSRTKLERNPRSLKKRELTIFTLSAIFSLLFIFTNLFSISSNYLTISIFLIIYYSVLMIVIINNNVCKSFKRIIKLQKINTENTISEGLLQEGIIVSFIVGIGLLSTALSGCKAVYERVFVNIFVFLLGGFIYFLSSKINSNDKLGLNIVKIIKVIFSKIKSHINFGHYVNIKINLGQDNLKEIDVLRYTASYLNENYSRWYTSFFPVKKAIWTVFYYIFIFLFSGIIYFSKPIYNFVNDLRWETQTHHYFPSQAVFYMKNGEKHKEVIDCLSDKFSNSSGIEIYILTLSSEISKNSLLNNINLKKEDWLPSGQSGNDYFLNSINTNFFKKTCITLDYFVFHLYNYSKKFIPFEDYLSIKGSLYHTENYHSDFHIIPPSLDYFFLIFVIFTLLFKRILFNKPFLGVTSHRYCLKRLRRLITNIEANIEFEKTGSIPAYGGSRVSLFSSRVRKSYPIMGAKEIEKELLSILDDINKIPKFSIRPRFIFIFDELDKIEPHRNISIIEKEAEGDIHTNFEIERSDQSRVRQEVITKILGNLKHFLNTASAKFIFIAGREMYDASLADISDRDSSIGSIFHEVIYVNSFFTDPSDNRITDITSMAERYVCQYLIPVELQEKEKETNKNGIYSTTLTGYYQYLSKKYEIDEATNNNEEIKEQIFKTIFTLYNFITYLAYRSNGAPKKITTLFEQYVKPVDYAKVERTGAFFIGGNVSNLSLNFNYYDQYRLGCTSYLFTPFLMTVSQHINEFGDKLLVSTSFLMDHLYKFHKYAFSWRTLELTPEIVAINKAPELRSFIDDLINFLSHTHLKEIFSGLYEFKFNKKISSEIQYISKISELESAAFNFTLDESIEIKRHYNKKLKHHKRNIANRGKVEKEYISSIAFLHVIIGDLHFYDQEYDDAILHYKDAVEPLRQLSVEQLSLNNLVSLIRNMLKLGLAYERKKSYDSAFMTYGELTQLILGVREVKIKNLGLKFFVLKEKDSKEFIEKHFNDSEHLFKSSKEGQGNNTKTKFTGRVAAEFEKSNFNEIVILGREKSESVSEVKLAPGNITLSDAFTEGASIIYKNVKSDLKFANWKTMETFYDFDGKNIANVLDLLPLASEKEMRISKISVFEGVRLLYQPLIAQLHLIEKGNIGGLTYTDLLRNKREFDFFIRTTNIKEKYFNTAEYFNKIGDILYYKNGYLPFSKNGNDKLIKTYISPNTIKSRYQKEPIAAYRHYMLSLHILTTRMIDYDIEQDIAMLNEFERGPMHEKLEQLIGLKIADFISEGAAAAKFQNTSKDFHVVTANTLIDVADTLICMSKGDNSTLSIGFLVDCLPFLSSSRKNVGKLKGRINYYFYVSKKPIEIAFIYYILGGLLYKKSGQFRLFISQLTKILHLIKELYPLKKSSSIMLSTDNLNIIEENIVSIALQQIYRSYENTNRPEFDKLRQIFGKKRKFSEDTLQKDVLIKIYNNATVSADVREIILIFTEIKIKNTSFDKLEYSIYESLVSPYGGVNNKYNRILELLLKAKVNYTFFQKLLEDCFFSKNGFANTHDMLEKYLDNIKPPLIFKLTEPNLLLNTPNYSRFLNCFKIDDKIDTYAAFEYLIADTIFCYVEVIKSYNIFGLNYAIANNSSLANAHEKLAYWCQYYLIIEDELEKKDPGRCKRFNKNLRELIGSHDVNYLSYRYNYEMALQYYLQMEQFHNEGKAYKNFINSIFYLEDDFNDGLLHFSAAMERYKINNGHVKNKIKKINKILNGTSLYQYSSYVKEK